MSGQRDSAIVPSKRASKSGYRESAVVESKPDLQSERYRNYLLSLARIQLAGAGPVRNKLEHSDLVQDVLTSSARSAVSSFVARLQKNTPPGCVGFWRTNSPMRSDTSVGASETRRWKRSFHESLNGTATSMLELSFTRRPSTPTHNIAKQERALRLADALQTLHEDQRTAVEMHYIGECSLTEIVEHMQRTKASVAGLLRRGLQERCGKISHQWTRNDLNSMTEPPKFKSGRSQL